MISGSDSHPTLVLIIPARLLIFISHFSKGVPVKLWFEFFWTIIVCMIARCITQDSNPLFPRPLPSPPLPTTTSCITTSSELRRKLWRLVLCMPWKTRSMQIAVQVDWGRLTNCVWKIHAQADKLWQFENWYANLKVEGWNNTILTWKWHYLNSRPNPMALIFLLHYRSPYRKKHYKRSRAQFTHDPAYFAR
jgi:hypothetical protein